MYAKLAGNLYRYSENGQKRIWLVSPSSHGKLELDSLRRLASRSPKDPNAWIALASAQARAGAIADAEQSYSRVLALLPDNDQIWLALGNLQFGRSDYPAALNSYMQALQINPSSYHAKNSLGILLKLLGQLELAEGILQEAVAIKPDFPEAHNTLGNLYIEMGRMDDAERHYRLSLSLGNDSAALWNNLGLLYKGLHRFDEALSCFDTALSRPEHDPNIVFNRAIALLRTERFESGWQAYEERWQLPNLAAKRKAYDRQSRYWQGEPLAGKRIVLWCEQGLGDALQMLRYVPRLRARHPDAEILLRLDPPLVRLAAAQGIADRVLDSKGHMPAADFHFSLLSFPAMFYGSDDAMPVDCPYLAVDPAWRADWRDRLPPPGRRKRLGLIWETGKFGVGQMDFERQRRSLSDDALAALLGAAPDRVEWVSLQPGGGEKLASLGADISHPGDALRDFADTAVLLEQLDGLVTVDTAGAHLAGAMAKPVLIMMSALGGNLFPADGARMPWYPTTELIRQRVSGDWSDVIGAVQERLSALSWAEPA
jgi:tetratricopeptide (TPR) repeat protein